MSADTLVRSTDHKVNDRRGRHVGMRSQDVHILETVANGVMRFTPEQAKAFTFVEAGTRDGTEIPAHWRLDIDEEGWSMMLFLRGGIEPGEVVTGNVEVKYMLTETFFFDPEKDNKSYNYYRVSFIGPADEEAALQEVHIGNTPPKGTINAHWEELDSNNAGVWVTDPS